MSPSDFSFGNGYANVFRVDSGGTFFGGDVTYERGVRFNILLKLKIKGYDFLQKELEYKIKP